MEDDCQYTRSPAWEELVSTGARFLFGNTSKRSSITLHTCVTVDRAVIEDFSSVFVSSRSDRGYNIVT